MNILEAAKQSYKKHKELEDKAIRKNMLKFACECFGAFASQLKETLEPNVLLIPDSPYKLEYYPPPCDALDPKFRLVGKLGNKTKSSIVYVKNLHALGEAIAML